MSGIAHAVKSVFKGVVGFVKKYWKPILAAVAIYFTAGAAAAYFAGAGAAGAAGGAVAAEAGAGAAAAGAGEVGATLAATGAGEAAAAGGLAAEAGTAAAIGSGVADASAIGAAYTGAAAAGAGEFAGAGALADLGAGAAAGAGAAEAGAGAADFAGNGMLSSYGADAAGDAAGTAGQTALDGSQLPGMNYTPGGADAGAGPSEPSSWWDSAKDFAANHSNALLQGGTRLLSGYLQGQQQQQMMDAQMKWAEEHAPGHVTGGVGNPFAGWKNNQNLSVTPQSGPYGKTPLAGGPNPAELAAVPQIPGQTYPQLSVGGLMGGGGDYNPNYGGGGPVRPWYPTGGPGGLMEMPYMDNPNGGA